MQEEQRKQIEDTRKRQEEDRKRMDEASKKSLEMTHKIAAEMQEHRRQDAERREQQRKFEEEQRRHNQGGGGKGLGSGSGDKKGGIQVCLPNTGRCSGFPVLLDMNKDGFIDLTPLADISTAGDLLSSAQATAQKTFIDTLTVPKGDKNSTAQDQFTPCFDWTGDGVLDQTAWVGPSDGMLVIDLAANNSSGPDGKIVDAKEIAFALWKTEDARQAELKEKGVNDTGQPVTDLEGLRFAFDSNHDNVLDIRDDRWNEFRVWQDKNQNGAADTGELLTMEQAGIRLIDLMPSKDGAKNFADGSMIIGTSQAL